MAASEFSECRPMFVDDDSNFIIPLKRCLDKLGVSADHVRFCRSGNAAIDLLSGKDALPSFVILDHKMPVKTGLEVLEWMKSQESLSGLRVFMLSTGAEPKLVARAKELGAEAWFEKPLGLEGLQDVLRNILSSWKAGKRGEPVPGSVDPLAGRTSIDRFPGSAAEGI